MVRSEAGLTEATVQIRTLRETFWNDVRVTGRIDTVNPELERALRVADFLELAELMCQDALQRKESCGAHYREEFVTEDGEAQRNDETYRYVSVWAHAGASEAPQLHREPLVFESVKLAERSYK